MPCKLSQGIPVNNSSVLQLYASYSGGLRLGTLASFGSPSSSASSDSSTGCTGGTFSTKSSGLGTSGYVRVG